MSTENKPELYLLFSVDIIDSTSRKYGNSNESWFLNIRQFYDEFSQLFYVNYTSFNAEKTGTIKDSENFINVWKLVGDEILFFVNIENIEEALTLIYSFAKTICSYNKHNKTGSNNNKKTLTVKGSIWTAQVPFIDRVYKSKQIDFVGPSVDCGFRIGKLSDQNKIAVSMEIASICLQDNENKFLSSKTDKFILSFGKMEFLKGVFKGETEYPVFFITSKENLHIHEKDLKSLTNKKQINKFLFSFYKYLQTKSIKDSISPLTFPISEYLASKNQLSEQIIKKDKTKVPEIELHGKIQNPEKMISKTKKGSKLFDTLDAKLK